MTPEPLPGGAPTPPWGYSPPESAAPPHAPAYGRPPRKPRSTALIVAVVVVVVLVVVVVPPILLYSLISGLTQSSPRPPAALTLEVVSTAGPTGSPTSYYVNVSVADQAGVSTDEVAFTVLNGSGPAPSLVGASGSCRSGAASPIASCVAGGAGWYAVLVSSGGSVAATYSASGGSGTWSNFALGTTSLPVNGSTLMVVSYDYLGTGSYRLDAVPTGAQSVFGAVVL
jgi:hypothetical protein